LTSVAASSAKGFASYSSNFGTKPTRPPRRHRAKSL
jgi:hypothetical protein